LWTAAEETNSSRKDTQDSPEGKDEESAVDAMPKVFENDEVKFKIEQDDEAWRRRIGKQGTTKFAAGSRNPFDDSLPRRRKWRGRQKYSPEYSLKTNPEKDDDDIGELFLL
jgi:hypothetical protein